MELRSPKLLGWLKAELNAGGSNGMARTLISPSLGSLLDAT